MSKTGPESDMNYTGAFLASLWSVANTAQACIEALHLNFKETDSCI